MHITPCFNHLKNLQCISSSLFTIYLANNGEMHIHVSKYFLLFRCTIHSKPRKCISMCTSQNRQRKNVKGKQKCALWSLSLRADVTHCSTGAVLLHLSSGCFQRDCWACKGTLFWKRGTQQATGRTYVVRMSVVVLEIATTVIRASTTLGDHRRQPNHVPSIQDTNEREETPRWTSEWWDATCEQVLPRSCWGVLQPINITPLAQLQCGLTSLTGLGSHYFSEPHFLEWTACPLQPATWSALTFPNTWLLSHSEKVAQSIYSISSDCK